MSLRKVLITDPVAPICVQILKENNIDVAYKPKLPVNDILKEIENYDGLIVRSGTKVTAPILAAAKNLKIVGRAGTGVDNIDCDAATRNGVVVMNTPGGNTLSAAEHTCAMMLALARKIPISYESLKSGKWERSSFMGNEVNGKTLAILGLGRIGREVAIRMQSFGMKTIGYDPIIPGHVSKEFGVESMTLEEIWPQADFITVHTPLIPETKNLINEAVFAKCKKGICIINVARGGIIDEAALLKALESGQCGGAALDVFLEEPPKDFSLIKHPSVVGTPHLGANTHEAQARVAAEIAEQFIDFAKGRDLIGVVNAPTISEALKAQNKPWVNLAECLGVIAATLGDKDMATTVTVHGSQLEKLSDLLGSAVLAGILRAHTTQNVNLINAPTLAKEKGMKVSTSVQPNSPLQGECCSPAVSVNISTGQQRVRLVGCASGNMSLLCSIDDTIFQGGVVLNKGNLLLFKDKTSADLQMIIGEIASAKGNIHALYCPNTATGWIVINTGKSSVSLAKSKPVASVNFSG